MEYWQVLEALTGEWCIDPGYVGKLLPFALAIINGQKIDISALETISKPKAYCINLSAEQINTVSRWDLYDENIPDDSVAVIQLNGPIMSWTSNELINQLQLIENNPRIISTLLLINTPGGMVGQLDNIDVQITSGVKPIIGFVLNIAASAGIWMISGTKKIFVSSKLSQLGSIGVYSTFMDMNRMLKEKLNIDIYEYYATKSTEKNQPTRGILNPDSPEEKKKRETELMNRLDWVNDMFHATVSKNRKISLDSEIFNGGIYFAEKAIELGIADDIKSMQYALEYAHAEGLKAKIKSFF